MGEKQAKTVFMRKRDILLLAVLLALAGVLWLIFRPGEEEGAYARVTVGLVTTEEVIEIPLNKNADYDIEGVYLPVHFEVLDGQIRFVHSECPDHVCEGFGWLSREGEWASCLPAGVAVLVIEE